MRNWRVYGAAGIFVGLTAVKLLFPEPTETVRAELAALIDLDMDYRGAAVQVGALLTEENVQAVFERFLDSGQPPKAVETSPVPETMPLTPSPSYEETEASPEPPMQQQEPSDEVLAAVEAFSAAQAAYADHETPENVSYGNLVIPFAYHCPVTGVTSSGFGYRVHPVENIVKFHYGTDFDVETGTAIAAFADGQVTMMGYEPGYGNYVELTHADGWKSFYAHCSQVQVSWGQEVTMGQVIALSGNTGVTTGPHLHFELKCHDQYTNPEFFV